MTAHGAEAKAVQPDQIDPGDDPLMLARLMSGHSPDLFGGLFIQGRVIQDKHPLASINLALGLLLIEDGASFS